MVAVEGEGQGKGWRKGLRVFSPEYYAVCAAGGMLSAGTTHLAITPLDVLKVNMQVNPVKYNSILSGLQILVKEQGPSSLWRGWAGKFYGYGANGGCKFGLYEYFKKMYSDVLGGQNRTFIYLISSASAQAIADVALCPFEAVKVRVQTQPKFGKGLVDGFPKLYATEGLSGFYKGLFPLWGRNIPCVDDDDEPQIHSVFGNVRRSLRKDLKDSLSIEPGIKITEEDSDSLVELRGNLELPKKRRLPSGMVLIQRKQRKKAMFSAPDDAYAAVFVRHSSPILAPLTSSSLPVQGCLRTYFCRRHRPSGCNLSRLEEAGNEVSGMI